MNGHGPERLPREAGRADRNDRYIHLRDLLWDLLLGDLLLRDQLLCLERRVAAAEPTYAAELATEPAAAEPGLDAAHHRLWRDLRHTVAIARGRPRWDTSLLPDRQDELPDQT